MGDIFDTVVDFFQREEWTYDQIPDQPILRLGMNGKSGKWVGYAQAREEQEQFVFYSVLPVTASEERRHAMAELLTKMNYGLVVGNWEMDYRDGEIRYKTSIDVEGDRLSNALVRNCVYLNLQMMDRCLPSIMAVLYGGLSVDLAVKQIEGQNTPPS